MRTRVQRGLAAALLVLAVGLAGCGDDDDEATDAADTTTTAAAGGEADGSGGDGEAAATVTMADFAFSPKELTVASGAVIEVKNEDSTAHTFTSDQGGFDVEVAAGASGEARVSASTPGTYDFMCTIHPSMTGTITVE